MDKQQQKQLLRQIKHDSDIIDSKIEKYYNKKDNTIKEEESEKLEREIFRLIKKTRELSFPQTIKGLYYKSRLQAMFLEISTMKKI